MCNNYGKLTGVIWGRYDLNFKACMLHSNADEIKRRKQCFELREGQ